MNRNKPATMQGIYMQVVDPKKIKKLMVVQEVSQRELARALGYKSHTHLRRVLDGTTKTVTPTKAAQIAAYFGVPMDDLFVPRVSTPAGQNTKGRAA